jgi:hypothetical protein
MIDSIKIIKKEHEQIKSILYQMEQLINEDVIDVNAFSNLLTEFEELWNAHELREENLFIASKETGGVFPEETALIEQHREFRGHWKVLTDAAASRNADEIRIAIDTDGKMLIDKFIKHIGIEEDYFDVIAEKLAQKNI